MFTPIQQLIEDRCQYLGLSRRHLICRAGYENTAKGLRRLDELLAGDLHTTRGLIDRLPVTLDVPPETVNAAISETDRQIRSEADQAYRASFKPHAIILTEHTRRAKDDFVASSILIPLYRHICCGVPVHVTLSPKRSVFVASSILIPLHRHICCGAERISLRNSRSEVNVRAFGPC
jgi:hypothetical protein